MFSQSDKISARPHDIIFHSCVVDEAGEHVFISHITGSYPVHRKFGGYSPVYSMIYVMCRTNQQVTATQNRHKSYKTPVTNIIFFRKTSIGNYTIGDLLICTDFYFTPDRKQFRMNGGFINYVWNHRLCRLS